MIEILDNRTKSRSRLQGVNPDDGAQTVHRLRALAVELNLLGAEFAQLHGLHTTDLRALICILDADRAGLAATPGWLGGQLGINSASVTALLDRMEKSGLIRRDRDADDRRRSLLAVTPPRRRPRSDVLRTAHRPDGLRPPRLRRCRKSYHFTVSRRREPSGRRRTPGRCSADGWRRVEVADTTRGRPGVEPVRLAVAGDHRARPDDTSVPPHRHSGEDDRACADPASVADYDRTVDHPPAPGRSSDRSRACS